ncbi:Nucleus-vacuole junction protein 2 [Fulvia fulva]|uniref:Nucleus-vacuole junction protein 2 n=1 Tax=Passalora fulva TaxID=5499 RepID=A0A9Q8UWC1_PASFU|nr:Nucleus-vacuole junction protein 2 [Fulvia fulva]UJO24894.1 Nucleus-vacuole junction protein 2 [Fulvia fulva]
MGFRTYAFVYVFGGLTFLPLLFAAVFLAAWKLLPRVVEQSKTGAGDDEVFKLDAKSEELARRAKEDRERQESIGDAAASGTFAVLRRYDFQAAIGAINARNNAGNTASTTNVAADATTPGDGSSGSTGESVYQSMYRSVFAGRQNNGSTNSLLHTDETLRKPVPASVVYIVLRHGHLMLYDSPARVEVKHVLSLAHHKVTLQAGKDGDDADEKMIPEADLFIKRTAIVLTPVELPNGALQQQNAQTPPKPFYLFSATNIEKEDFYHALLYARSKPPTPRPLDSDALIKLQSMLHSSSLTSETRALNALLGRVFLGVHHGERLVDFVRAKIERKLNRIQKPNFITSLRLRSLDLGDAGPVFTNLKLRDLNISGDTTISADMRYNGGLSITLLAVAKLDLGQRFKTRTVDLVLKTSLKRVQGTMLLHIKPPPSNRLWFTFETMPELEIRVEPVVSERKITYGFVLRAIEERVRSAIAEGLVKPNWDDVPFPMQDTRGSSTRGGSWSDVGQEEHVPSAFDSAKFLAERNEKTMSVPEFQQEPDTATSTSLWSNSELNVGRLRHASTMPPNALNSPSQNSNSTQDGRSAAQNVARAAQSTARPPKPLRSPSISSSAPSVAIDGQTVEPVRSDDPALRPTSSGRGKIWRPRNNQPPQQKDALDELRDLRDRAKQAVANPSSLTTSDSEDGSRTDKKASLTDADESDDTPLRSRQESASSESTIGTTPRAFSLRSTDSERSAMTSSASSSRSQQTQQRKANLIAAAGAATNAAKNWGWNAIQRNKAAFPRTPPKPEPGSQSSKEPMGRGQPLPPPGQPLPGPQKGIWGTVGNMRRKPVPNLPARGPGAGASHTDADGSSSAKASSPPIGRGGDDGIRVTAMEDEFGTWQENVVGDGGDTVETEVNPREPTSTADNKATKADEPSSANASEEDLLDLGHDDFSSQSQKPATPNPSTDSTRKAPPPLPARRRENAASQASAPAASKIEATVATSKAEDSDDSESVPLKVPENTASAIARENLTTDLAHGSTDDAAHVDEQRGVDAEVLPDQDLDALRSKGSHEQGSKGHPSREDLTLRRTDTDERFLRGENFHVEDFEDEQDVKRSPATLPQPQDKAQDSATSHLAGMSVPMNVAEDDDLARRIKAQVEKYSQAPAETSSKHARVESDITPATGW